MQNFESDQEHHIPTLWDSSWAAREACFAENRKLKRKDHYLSFKCISEYDEGISLVGEHFLE